LQIINCSTGKLKYFEKADKSKEYGFSSWRILPLKWLLINTDFNRHVQYLSLFDESSRMPLQGSNQRVDKTGWDYHTIKLPHWKYIKINVNILDVQYDRNIERQQLSAASSA
jgi:hypothetical protein